jgi:hypothetical protein
VCVVEEKNEEEKSCLKTIYTPNPARRSALQAAHHFRSVSRYFMARVHREAGARAKRKGTPPMVAAGVPGG